MLVKADQILQGIPFFVNTKKISFLIMANILGELNASSYI